MLLPNENVMLSLKDAKLEQKLTFLGRTGKYMEHDGNARALENRTGMTHAEAMNATSATPPNLDIVSADILLITDKRMVFIDGGRSIHEIIIDKEYAREVLRARGQNNEKAKAEFRKTPRASYLERMRGKGKHLRDFGFIGGSIFLLKNAERKDRIMRKPEVQLDIFKFYCDYLYAGQAGGPLNRIPKGLRSISDGHLAFSDLEQLSDKLLNFLKPKLAVMSDYLESEQYNADYNG